MEKSKLRRWLEGVRTGEKLPKKNQLLILLLAGVLLFVIVLPVPDGKEGDGKEGGAETEPAAVRAETDPLSYEAYLEEKTAQALQYVEGVGRVKVMITLKSSGQKIVEKDQQSSTQTTEETDSGGGTRTAQDTSSDKTSIYEQDSDGSQTPYVSKELTPEIEGVIIIADGGDNAVVVQNITEAVQASFGVEAHKIKIMKRADT